MYSCGPPLMDVQEWDDQHELTYSSYVRTRVVILRTCRRRWMIGRNGERRSGISAQAARHDDDDDASATNSTLNLILKFLCCLAFSNPDFLNINLLRKCCTPYIMDSPSSINTHQREHQTECTNQRDTITCDTICVVGG